MGRGIFSGLIWGGISGGLVVSVLSLYAPLPAERDAMVEPVDEPDVSSDTQGQDSSSVADPDVKAVTVQEELFGQTATTNSDTVAATTQPAPGSAEQATEKTDEPGDIILTRKDVSPDVQVSAPQSTDVRTTQRVVQAPASDSAVPGRASPLLQGNSGATDGGLLLDDAAPNAPSGAPDVSRAPSAPAIAETSVTLLSSAANISPTAPSPGGLAAPLSEAVPEADLQTAARVPGPEASVAEASAQAPDVTPVSSDTPITLPVPTIENPVSNVVTNRLPSLATPQPGTADTTANPVVLDANEVGALRAFAAPFEGPVTTNMFSLILVDVGAAGMPQDELLQLEVPFSVAIDPSSPNAAARAKAYRDAGIEVLVLASDLPETAAPSDVAVALGGYFNVLDQAIALLDPVDGRIQNNRDLLQPVLGAIRETGHGLVTYDRGLNTAQQAARREGIASATVFRLLDEDQEEAPRIKRYLNRAAFTASKDGAVVVVGHSYPDTVTAMLEWALDEKTSELTVVPVSQILMPQDG